MKTVRPDIAILRTLLQAGDDVVSGNALARDIGVSRVAVWQHLEKLREQGFSFESLHAKGYRLIGQPATLNASLVSALMGDDAGRVIVLDEVESTNDEAGRLLASGRPAPFVVLARRQTRGRGRFGRVWDSATAGNLYASFGFRPEVEPARMQTFTLWMGVNVCDLVARFCRTAPGVKWPNDLLFDDRKAGGMLTEARMDTDRIHDLVFGLGINLAPPHGGWRGELAGRATSLAEHVTRPVDPNRFAAALATRVFHACEKFIDGSYRDDFADLWNQYDLLRGRPIAVLHGDRRIPGTAVGVDDEGALLIKTAAGRTERFRAGEVTLEKPAR